MSASTGPASDGRRAGPDDRLPIRMLHDRVLVDPEDKAEVEVRGEAYVLRCERDLHAVAAERLEGDGQTGRHL